MGQEPEEAFNLHCFCINWWPKPSPSFLLKIRASLETSIIFLAILIFFWVGTGSKYPLAIWPVPTSTINGEVFLWGSMGLADLPTLTIRIIQLQFHGSDGWNWNMLFCVCFSSYAGQCVSWRENEQQGGGGSQQPVRFVCCENLIVSMPEEASIRLQLPQLQDICRAFDSQLSFFLMDGWHWRHGWNNDFNDGKVFLGCVKK